MRMGVARAKTAKAAADEIERPSQGVSVAMPAMSSFTVPPATAVESSPPVAVPATAGSQPTVSAAAAAAAARPRVEPTTAQAAAAAPAPPAAAKVPRVQPLPTQNKRRKLLSRQEILAASAEELDGYIRMQGWHMIKIPAWEGTQWCIRLEKLAAQEITKEHVADDIWRKQERQQNAAEKDKRREAKSAPVAAAAQAPRETRKQPRVSSTRPSVGSSAKPKADSKTSAVLPMVPSTHLAGWARSQVVEIVRQVKARPRVEWRNALKQSMLRFHPDKKSAPDNPFAARTDEEVAGVFMDVKRFYDSLSKMV